MHLLVTSISLNFLVYRTLFSLELLSLSLFHKPSAFKCHLWSHSVQKMKKLHVENVLFLLHFTLNHSFRDPSLIHLIYSVNHHLLYSPHYLFLGHSSVFISAHSYLPPFCRVDALVMRQ